MKREFGKKLVEQFFPDVQLTHVIDTSGAYIPGHGTPTVILVGRNHIGRKDDKIRAVLGIRGEPSQPADPSAGLVWSAIAAQVSQESSESTWVSTEDMQPGRLRGHPWALGGGGAGPVIREIEKIGGVLADLIVKPIGRSVRVGADEIFMRPLRWFPPHGCVSVPLMLGEVVRDWDAQPEDSIYYPYRREADPAALSRELWSWRTTLAARRTFQGDMADAGLRWFEYMQHTPSAYSTPLSIVFAFVATHNHFVLDRGGKVFKQSAPVIKLPEGRARTSTWRCWGCSTRRRRASG